MPSFMEEALAEARAAAAAGEVPIGCVIVREGAVIARTRNVTIAARDPTAHADMLAIRAAAEALSSASPAPCAPPRSRPRAAAGSTTAPPAPRAGRSRTG